MTRMPNPNTLLHDSWHFDGIEVLFVGRAYTVGSPAAAAAATAATFRRIAAEYAAQEKGPW